MNPDLLRLSLDARYYWHVRYGGSTDGIHFEQLNISVWCEALEMARRLNWRIVPGVEAFRNAARLAVGQHLGIQATCTCAACIVTCPEGGKACKACDGTGRRALTHFELRRIIGCTGPEYAARWIPRLQAITEILEGYDREIAGLEQQTTAHNEAGTA